MGHQDLWVKRQIKLQKKANLVINLWLVLNWVVLRITLLALVSSTTVTQDNMYDILPFMITGI